MTLFAINYKDVKNILFVGLLLLPFLLHGCSDDKKDDGDPIEYIDVPLLPMEGMYWGMLRPEDGGEINGYVFDSGRSGLGLQAGSDYFVNEAEKKIWHLSYVNNPYGTDYNYHLRSIRYVLYSEDERDIDNFIDELNGKFETEIPRNNLLGIEISTKNTYLLLINSDEMRWDALTTPVSVSYLPWPLE